MQNTYIHKREYYHETLRRSDLKDSIIFVPDTKLKLVLKYCVGIGNPCGSWGGILKSISVS